MVDHPTNPNYESWHLGRLAKEANRLEVAISDASDNSTTTENLRAQANRVYAAMDTLYPNPKQSA